MQHAQPASDHGANDGTQSPRPEKRDSNQAGFKYSFAGKEDGRAYQTGSSKNQPPWEQPTKFGKVSSCSEQQNCVGGDTKSPGESCPFQSEEMQAQPQHSEERNELRGVKFSHDVRPAASLKEAI